MQVLVMDVCLVLNVPSRTTRAILLATILWLVVVSSEAATRWGLFDVPFAAMSAGQTA
eukprot:gene13043-5522_t